MGSQASGAVQVWDLGTRQLVRSIPLGDGSTVDWSPDGDRVAIGSLNRAPVRLVDIASGEDVIVLRGHPVGASDVVFIGDGERLASVGGDLRVWNVTDGGPPDVGAMTARGRASPSATGSRPTAPRWPHSRLDRAEFLSTDTGEPLRPAITDLFDGPVSPIVSPDWRQVALVRSDGHGEIRDLTSRTPVRQLPDCAAPRGISRDGSLVVLDGRVLCTTDCRRAADRPAGRRRPQEPGDRRGHRRGGHRSQRHRRIGLGWSERVRRPIQPRGPIRRRPLPGGGRVRGRS